MRRGVENSVSSFFMEVVMIKFKCINCGSNKLMFIKWVKCEETVIFHNEHIEYQQNIYEDDILEADYGYICGSCRKHLQFHYFNIQTESQLQNYIEFYSEEIIYSQD